MVCLDNFLKLSDMHVPCIFDHLPFVCKLQVSWKLPLALLEEEEEETEGPEIVSSRAAVLPTPSPSPDVPTSPPETTGSPSQRRRRQDNEMDDTSQPGSRMGSSELGMDEEYDIIPEPFGDVVAILVYMGTERLAPFDPRPSNNVEEFKVHVQMKTAI